MITTFIFILTLVGVVIYSWKDIKDHKRDKIWFFTFIVLSLMLSMLFSFQQTLHQVVVIMNHSIGGLTKMVLNL